MENLFTNADYEEMLADGMSEEDIEILKDATALAETVDMIPDDVSTLTDLMSALPNNLSDATFAVSSLAEKNPKLYAELMALTSLAIANNDSEVVPVSDPLLADLSVEDRDAAEERFFQALASMDETKKAEFIKLLQNLSPEAKGDLIQQLTK